MITKALLFRFESQTDEDTMDTFLEDLATDVSWEKATQAWFGIRYMRGEFGMYSVYDDEAGREAGFFCLLATLLGSRTPPCRTCLMRSLFSVAESRPNAASA